jgi:hypothetical protein
MNEQLSEILESRAFLPTVIGVASFGLGIGVGYILGKRVTERKTVIELEQVQEIIRARKDIFGPGFDDGFEDEIKGLQTPDEDITVSIREVPVDKPGVIVRVDANEIEKVMKVDIPTFAPPPDPPVTYSIFTDPIDDWSYEEEEQNRTDTKPYVLHRDEFYAEERGYSQTTLTFYAGDKIMVDQENVPVYNFEDVVGPLLFGHGSGDQNVFHVRNTILEAEFEVLNDHGHYSVEVLGLEDIDDRTALEDKHLKHSGDRVRRFRQDD